MDIGIGIAIVLALVVGVIGFVSGRAGGSGKAREEAARGAAARSEERLRALEEALSHGRLPDADAPGTPEAGIRQALEAGWAPRGEERQRALREAVERVGGFLDQQVRAPLRGAGPDADAEELRERIERALGSLQDLDFFLEEPAAETQGHNLSSLVQQVTREFARDQDVLVRLRMSGPVRAEVNAPAFMDALYLILHNAGRFSDGAAVDVTVEEDEGRVAVRVRDQGPGFSEEAFKRAFDPFYSTAPDGLGLGLPHARRTLEAMGGRLELTNAPDGGAEVEVSFPR